MSGQENTWILFFIKRTKLLKNGEAPIFVRITINKERTEFSLKKHVSPKIWDDKKERAKGRTSEIAELNEFIDLYRRMILSYIDFMVLDNQPVTARIIQEKLVGKKENRRTILKVFKTHVSYLVYVHVPNLVNVANLVYKHVLLLAYGHNNQ